MQRFATMSVIAALAALHQVPAKADAARMESPADVTNLSLSHGGTERSASVPKIALDPADPDRIAVIWRYLSMDAHVPGGEARTMICHLSISTDGGGHFSDQAIDWGLPDTPKCNAPYVDIGPDGEIIIGATLAGDLPQNAPEGTPPPGRVAFRKSLDGGQSWTPTADVISAAAAARFAPNPAVPEDAKKIPWDGARGVFDQETGAIIASGGFPAPPGGELHSQRFYSVSRDGGATWGPIRAFGTLEWPQRWDGHMIAAHGRLAVTYLAGAVPDETRHCLCVVFATGADDGATLDRHLVTEVQDFDTLVHYPPAAADPTIQGAYAVALISKEAATPSVLRTADGGKTWRPPLSPEAPTGVKHASRPALAYTPKGVLVLLWRGYYADGSYDVFMAAAAAATFGRPVRVTTMQSHVPETLMKDYSVRGDFINVIAAGPDQVHAAWTDWRSGTTGQVYYGRVPLRLLLSGQQ
jgi:hypothetical protein